MTKFIKQSEEFVFIGFPNVMDFASEGDYRAFCSVVRELHFPLTAQMMQSGKTVFFPMDGKAAMCVSFMGPIKWTSPFVDRITM